jgi:hypothetical protein
MRRTEDEEAPMGAAFREFGYMTGQAFACLAKEQHVRRDIRQGCWGW